MHAEITHAKDKELEFKILDVDISILYIVQHELQKNNDNKFAGCGIKTSSYQRIYAKDIGQ